MISRYLKQIALLLLITITTTACLDQSRELELDAREHRYVQMQQEQEIEIPEDQFDQQQEQDFNLRRVALPLLCTVGCFLGLNFIQYCAHYTVQHVTSVVGAVFK